MSWLVTERTHEIGGRMAMGERRTHMWGLVLKRGLRVAAAGLIGGTLVAWGLERLLRDPIFGVAPTDPAVFLPVPSVLVTIVAAWLPARRATRVDPIVALRCDSHCCFSPARRRHR